MNFFEGLSEEAKGLMSFLDIPSKRREHWMFKLEIKHQVYNSVQIEVIELPYVWYSKHNASLMYNQLNGSTFDEIRFLMHDYPKVKLGEIKSFFVRWCHGAS